MAQRKLQQEIERVFKRVNEGLSAFDFLYEKVICCENQLQKEKLESDLKKEIKKLQRQREQIKNWISGNDVKDKKPLMEFRRKIEKQMERFKLVERDMKTKAFSREGLSMEKRLDPREKEKNETSDFISDQIDKITQQNEAHEAKIAQIQLSVKKNKKISLLKQNQINLAKETLEKNAWHLSKLEMILRYLENGQIEADQVNEIRESIAYYVDSNQDPDFYDDDTIYDDLGLDEVDPAFGNVGEFAPNPDSDEEDLDDDDDMEKSGVLSSRGDDDVGGQEITAIELLKEQSLSPTLASVVTPKKQPVIQDGASISRTTSNSILNNLKPAPVPKTAEVKYSTLAQQVKPPALTKTKLAVKPVPTVEKIAPVLEDLTLEDPSDSDEAFEEPGVMSYLPGLQDLIPLYKENKTRLEDIQTLGQPESHVDQQHFIDSYSVANEKVYKYIGDSLVNCPDSVDSEKPFKYSPSKPHPTPIDYPDFEPALDNVNAEGKQKQDYHPNFCLINSYSNKEFFKKLAVESLFFIFYYGDDTGTNKSIHLNKQPNTSARDSKDLELAGEIAPEKITEFSCYNNGTYIQYLALKELYARNWKFNRQLHVWFQPVEDGGKKVFRFFDFEIDWTIKLKLLELDLNSQEFESW